MTPYSYQRPQTLADVIAARGQAADTFLLAGGTDLIAQMKSGQRRPAHVVDVKAVPEMSQIQEIGDGGLEIGAAVSATKLAARPDIAQLHPGLHDAVQLIGSHQIQNRASLGGNICNAAPSADAVPPLIVDRARVRIGGPAGEREIAIEDVFDSPGRTTLTTDEVLISIILPPPLDESVDAAAVSSSAYLRFTPRREMDIAIAGAAVRLVIGGDGSIKWARVALASVAPVPLRAAKTEAVLADAPLTASTLALAGEAAREDAMPISDTRASADYRRDLSDVLVRRAIAIAADRAGHTIAST